MTEDNTIEMKTYDMPVRCWNCGKRDDVKVSYGKTFDSVERKYKCQNCGCNSMSKDSEKLYSHLIPEGVQ